MAKKKPEPPANPSPEPPVHRVRLELTATHRDQLRVLAAKAGMSMASYARAVLIRDIEKEGQ